MDGYSLEAPVFEPQYIHITNTPYCPRGAQAIDGLQAPFWTFSCGGVLGVNLARASMRGSLDELDGRYEPLFVDERSKIAYRLLVDGYEVFSKQMNSQCTKDKKRVPIPRSKVVEQIAKVVSQFIKQVQNQAHRPDQYLQFGPGSITLENIYLLGLRQVSAASYQVILGVLFPEPSFFVSSEGLNPSFSFW